MHPTWERTALQKAADQVIVRGNLKGSGIGATIFGVLALFAAIQPPLDPLLLAVGAMLALVGIWNLTNPSPVGLLFMACTLVVVGLYNVTSVFLDAAAGGKPSTIWAMLGVWQVIWGIQGFNRWKRFQHTFDTPVDSTQRANAKALLDALRKTSAKKSTDVIEFLKGGMSPKAYRVRLMPDMAVALMAGDEEVRVLAREEFAIDAEGEPKKMRKVKIRMGVDTFTGTVPAESYDRFHAWKNSSATPLRAAA